ncbi:MAG: lipid-A-disaccharide synthase [Candidatus Cloacimonetes bacterium]|nr:lipid-A-disaccharide synthase [Candidatus Cloacimonadota bacterium]
MKNIFILAGERSADLHTSRFIKQIQNLVPDIAFWGVGGPRLQTLGFESLFPFERFSLIGFIEALSHFRFFFQVIQRIKGELTRRKPDLVILVDYPGLNIRIAKIAHNMKIPVLYYISPQVWAWKKKRIYKIKRYTDKIAVIFPFEKELYENIGADVEFVGHPIAEEITFQLSKVEFAKKYNLDKNKKWLAFIPGSRDVEIKRILPAMVKTINDLQRTKCNDFEFLISLSYTISKKQFDQIIEPVKSYAKIVSEVYEIMKYSSLVICKSGTSALEAGYIGTPMIVVYKTSLSSYFIAKFLIKIKMIAMPNIILGKKVIPELVQKDVNSKNIIRNIDTILNNKKNYQKIKNELSILHEKLEKKKVSESASLRVAKIALSMINEKENKE